MGQISGLPSFSEADIQKVLGTPEGRSLLQLFRQDSSNTLQKAADALKAGDTNRAQELLRPMMESPAVAELIRKINGR
ncbi:MAG: hypothetical protein IKM36_06905 [Oscillospiraceae bacterium]|nr:hypothetical protein [Oscillospiraceae bacterium]MBR2977174.1 hypothetical protein [Oscillospiraceae bacterium]MBR3850198.1 hypothetical protein [Oscillospiraceae bacterium]